ncbi:MAG: hypothetical protein M3Z24_02805, partial [Chloroflexota bacterium]|nr:hypothetical protein [Chloroflexota bacterium]
MAMGFENGIQLPIQNQQVYLHDRTDSNYSAEEIIDSRAGKSCDKIEPLVEGPSHFLEAGLYTLSVSLSKGPR